MSFRWAHMSDGTFSHVEAYLAVLSERGKIGFGDREATCFPFINFQQKQECRHPGSPSSYKLPYMLLPRSNLNRQQHLPSKHSL